MALQEKNPPRPLRPIAHVRFGHMLKVCIEGRGRTAERSSVSIPNRDPTSRERWRRWYPNTTRRSRSLAHRPELLRAIDGYAGHVVTAYALKLAPLLFVRPGELRHAEWTEFDLDSAEPHWRIPAEKMKMGEQHVVPLAKQALVLLRELQSVTGRGQYVFPSLRSGSRPMSENTVNAALASLGYSTEEMTGHGFRSLAIHLLERARLSP
jgi:integrase